MPKIAQGSLACCSPWGHEELDMTWRLKNKKKNVDFNLSIYFLIYDTLDSILCLCYALLCLVTHSYSTLCDHMDCSLQGSSVHQDSPGKNTGVGCHALLQGIFPTQGSNPSLSHCRRIPLKDICCLPGFSFVSSLNCNQ